MFINDLAYPLKSWFQSQKRDLPWRQQANPYAVWISEVMLQQTQVTVVIPYFERWMRRFPTIESLALAPVEAAIKAWEGLGYYSRVRNLHEGARYILKEHGGQLPADAEALAKIKGIGPYTVGAIRSFAFYKKAAAVDGNVMRVMARYFYLEDDLNLSKNVSKIRLLVEKILPEIEPWIVMEALIELGATVCTKKPKCSMCPVRSHCQAYAQGDTERLPTKSGKVKIEKLFRAVTVVSSNEGRYLVKKVAKGKVMSDLYEFPYFDIFSKDIALEQLFEKIKNELDLSVTFQCQLPIVKHAFTKYSVTLVPFQFRCDQSKIIPNYLWLLPEEIKQLAFSSGHRRLYSMVIQNIPSWI